MGEGGEVRGSGVNRQPLDLDFPALKTWHSSCFIAHTILSVTCLTFICIYDNESPVHHAVCCSSVITVCSLCCMYLPMCLPNRSGQWTPWLAGILADE